MGKCYNTFNVYVIYFSPMMMIEMVMIKVGLSKCFRCIIQLGNIKCSLTTIFSFCIYTFRYRWILGYSYNWSCSVLDRYIAVLLVNSLIVFTSEIIKQTLVNIIHGIMYLSVLDWFTIELFPGGTFLAEC